MGNSIRDMDFSIPIGDSKIQHKVKIFDDTDIPTVEAAVTAFIDSLYNPADPKFYIKDIQYSNYINQTGVPTNHHSFMVWYVLLV
jgi:hypothetical protein